jgi:predicted kinase
MLYVFAGLPGTGKTTLARLLAAELRATHVRVDSIEEALREAGLSAVGPAGYVAAYRIAADNLRIGLPVVADSVNPLRITRKAWREVAKLIGVPYVDVEIVCSDATEHRSRIESRADGSEARPRLSWDDVCARRYDPWDSPPVVIDTAGQTPARSFQSFKAALAAAIR